MEWVIRYVTSGEKRPVTVLYGCLRKSLKSAGRLKIVQPVDFAAVLGSIG